jgi:hypothetical protein
MTRETTLPGGSARLWWVLAAAMAPMLLTPAAAPAQCPRGSIDPPGDPERSNPMLLRGDHLFVGLPREGPGLVHVYARDASNAWTLAETIQPPLPDTAVQFGFAMAWIESGPHLLVTDPADAGGVVWQFTRSGDQWRLTDEVRPDGVSYDARFGHAIDAVDELLLVGAPNDDASPYGPGLAYFFVPDARGWQLQTRRSRRASDDIRHFGAAVAASSTTAVVGGLSGDVAYSYRRNGATWVFHWRLGPTGSSGPVAFGSSVHAEEGWAYVADPNEGGRGVVYIYDLGRINWVHRLMPWIDADRSAFGRKIARVGDRLVIQDGNTSPTEQTATYIFARCDGCGWIPDRAIRHADRLRVTPTLAADDDGQAIAIHGGPDGAELGIHTFSLRRRCLCPADFNEDGSINPGDVTAFLNAWNGRDPDTDINADGAIDSRDVGAFLSLWHDTRSCP